MFSLVTAMITTPFTAGISGIQTGTATLSPFSLSCPPPPSTTPSSSTSNLGMGTIEHYSARIPCLLQTKVRPQTPWQSFDWDYQNANTPSNISSVAGSSPPFKFKMWNLGQLYSVRFPFSASTTTMYSSYCAIVRRPPASPSTSPGNDLLAFNITRALENGGSGTVISGGVTKANRIGSYVALGDLIEGDTIALYRNCIELAAASQPPEDWRDQNGELFIPGLFVNAYPTDFPAQDLVFNKYVELVCVIKYEDITVEILDEAGKTWKVIVDDFGTIRNATVGILQYA